VEISSSSVRNRLLLALPAADLRDILRLMEVVALRQGQLLTERDWPIQRIYFIESGSACLFFRGKGPVEIEMEGRFGMIGLPIVLGVSTAPFRSVVQLPGRALSLSASDFRLAMAKHPNLGNVLLKYVLFRLIAEAQAASCNAKHRLEQRLSKWLLKAYDHIDGDKVEASHESLSRMLGVRRAGITTQLGIMEQQKIVHTRRCSIEIIDREKLAERTCDCYRFVQAEYRRLIPIATAEHSVKGGVRTACANADYSV